MKPFRAAVVLAAGGSRRMGRPKALLPWGEEPLVVAHARALAPVADEVLVVVGAGADEVTAVLPAHVRVVHNPDWERSWPSDSARLAVSVLAPPLGRVLVTPVDVVPADPRWLWLLGDPAGAAVLTDLAGVPGHPVVLGPREVAALVGSESLPAGLAGLLSEAERIAVDSRWVTVDFDTPEAYGEARSRHPDG